MIWDMSGNVAEWVRDTRSKNFLLNNNVGGGLANMFLYEITEIQFILTLYTLTMGTPPQLSSSKKIKDLFGPSKNYVTFRSEKGWTTNNDMNHMKMKGLGLGKIYGHSNQGNQGNQGTVTGVISRGGFVSAAHIGGVFTTDVQRTINNAHALIGFRCVYHPPAAQ